MTELGVTRAQLTQLFKTVAEGTPIQLPPPPPQALPVSDLATWCLHAALSPLDLLSGIITQQNVLPVARRRGSEVARPAVPIPTQLPNRSILGAAGTAQDALTPRARRRPSSRCRLGAIC